MAFAGNNDSEREALKKFMVTGIFVATAGLFALNTTGAFIGSGGNIAYTGMMGGVEIMLVPIFALIVLGRTRLRKVAGFIIFLALVWTAVENGKFAVKHSFDEIFVDTPASLRLKADLLDEQAVVLNSDDIARTADDLETLRGIREQIARLDSELDDMVSTTPAGIEKAQRRLQALGYYQGAIDGISESLTENARLRRGEEISRELDLLKRQAAALTPSRETSGEAVDIEDIGSQSITLTAAQQSKATAIEMREKADEIEYRTVWMHIILWGVEGARSLGVWAFIITSTATGTRRAFNSEVADLVGEPDHDFDADDDEAGKPDDLDMEAESGAPDPHHPNTDIPDTERAVPNDEEIARAAASERARQAAEARWFYRDGRDAQKIPVGDTIGGKPMMGAQND